MKQKQKKPVLKKIKIQRLTIPLDRDKQKEINGGSQIKQIGGSVPIFCLTGSLGNE